MIIDFYHSNKMSIGSAPLLGPIIPRRSSSSMMHAAVVGYFEFVFAFCWHEGLILGGEIDQETSCVARRQNIEAQSDNLG